MIRKKKIAKQLKTDKRGEQFRIEPLSTMAVIRSNGYTIDGELKISWTKLRRLAKEINLALAIKETHDKQNMAKQVQVMDTSKLTPIVVEQTTSLPSSQVLLEEKKKEEPINEPSIEEKKLETIKNIYKLLKSEFQELPKFKDSKFQIHSHHFKTIRHRTGGATYIQQGTCCDSLGGLAHCHPTIKNKGWRKYSKQICFQRKTLKTMPLVVSATGGRTHYKLSDGTNSDVYDTNCLAEMVAHESAHLMGKGHGKSWKLRNRRYQEFLRKCELDGRLQKCCVGHA